MARRMTIVFDDEELYTALKVQAARTHRPAKEIVATALELLFESTAEEQDAIIARARMTTYSRRVRPGVERVLHELGLKR